MNTILTLVFLLILVILAAFFASSETAYLSISSVRLRQMKKDSNRLVRLAANLKQNQGRLLTTILIGTNVVVNLSSSVAAALAISIAGQSAVGIATVAVSLVIILFGEILPKNTASFMPEKTARNAALPLYVVQKVLFPLVWTFEKINSGIEKLVNVLWHDDAPTVTEEELKTLIDVGNEEGTLETDEKDMLYKIFEFTDLRVRDIQKHRSLVTALDENAGWKETVTAITASGYSRIPVYKETAENIVGLVHYKDVLYYRGNKETFTASDIMRGIMYVPETVLVETLLKQFRSERRNFAVVMSEHGSVSGIVTMDDILQAVFGRITDEYNQTGNDSVDRVRVVGKREFVIPGDMLIEDFNQYFKQKLSSEEYDTMGGWLLDVMGYLPEAGEKAIQGNILYLAESVHQRRIQSIRIRFLPRQG